MNCVMIEVFMINPVQWYKGKLDYVLIIYNNHHFGEDYVETNFND